MTHFKLFEEFHSCYADDYRVIAAVEYHDAKKENFEWDDGKNNFIEWIYLDVISTVFYGSTNTHIPFNTYISPTPLKIDQAIKLIKSLDHNSVKFEFIDFAIVDLCKNQFIKELGKFQRVSGSSEYRILHAINKSVKDRTDQELEILKRIYPIEMHAKRGNIVANKFGFNENEINDHDKLEFRVIMALDYYRGKKEGIDTKTSTYSILKLHDEWVKVPNLKVEMEFRTGTYPVFLTNSLTYKDAVELLNKFQNSINTHNKNLRLDSHRDYTDFSIINMETLEYEHPFFTNIEKLDHKVILDFFDMDQIENRQIAEIEFLRKIFPEQLKSKRGLLSGKKFGLNENNQDHVNIANAKKHARILTKKVAEHVYTKRLLHNLETKIELLKIGKKISYQDNPNGKIIDANKYDYSTINDLKSIKRNKERVEESKLELLKEIARQRRHIQIDDIDTLVKNYEESSNIDGSLKSNQKLDKEIADLLYQNRGKLTGNKYGF